MKDVEYYRSALRTIDQQRAILRKEFAKVCEEAAREGHSVLELIDPPHLVDQKRFDL